MNILLEITNKDNADFLNKSVGDKISISFEQYIAGVVQAEIGNNNIEACKAQAIAARTYAVKKGVLNGTPIKDNPSTDQAFRAKNIGSNCVAGAQETRGQVLFYNGAVANTVYCSSNGGRSISAESKWGGRKPYLIEQNDEWTKNSGYPKKGHGVGMSQRGAIWAGAHGISYKDILAFYYPKTELVSNYGIKDVVNISKGFLQSVKSFLQSMNKKLGEL